MTGHSRNSYRPWVVTVVLCAWWTLAGWAASNHVVIISLDGLRPEFYLPGAAAAACPTLVELREQGSYAKAAVAVYPSMTYPGHATIATGVRPARHGITANNLFEPPDVEGRGFWYAADLRVPALWDVAHAAGLTVATVSWPGTAGAKAIRWNLAEFWPTKYGRLADMVRRYSTPSPTLAALSVGDEKLDWDGLVLAYTLETIREQKPNLLLVHFVAPDKVQHRGGRAAAELPATMTVVDGYVAQIIEATKVAGIYPQTTFIVCGDHGFANVSNSLAPNLVLAQNGFIQLDGKTVTDWKAMVRNTGGSAGVYLKDANDAETRAAVWELLAKHAVPADGARLYRLVPQEELAKLGGPADAAFYLEAEPGYMFTGSLSGSNLVRGATLKGNHGHNPHLPDLHTGFLCAGRGIKPGVVLDEIGLVDLAPTVSALLGLRLENVDGQPLKAILAGEPDRK